MPAPIPTMMHGRQFPSQAAAARALGCTRFAVWKAIEEGREVGGSRGRKGVKCYVSGKVYPSAKAAADALGVSPQEISRRRAKMRAAA